MIRLTRTPYGANIVVGIYGNTKEEVEQCFNGIYNFNGCPSITELDWIQENETKGEFLATFQTNEDRLVRAFTAQNINKLVYPTKAFNGKEIKKMALQDALTFIEQMPSDPSLNEQIAFAVGGH